MDGITPMLKKKLRFRCWNYLTKIELVVSSNYMPFSSCMHSLSLPCFVPCHTGLISCKLPCSSSVSNWSSVNQWDAWWMIGTWEKGGAKVFPFCSVSSSTLSSVSTRQCVLFIISTPPLVDELLQGSPHYGSNQVALILGSVTPYISDSPALEK